MRGIPAAVEPSREFTSRRHLPIEGPSAGAEVGDGVPGFRHNETASRIIPKKNVDPIRRSLRADAQLKCSGKPCASSETENEFLNTEMPGIGCFGLVIATQIEARREAELVGKVEPDADRCSVSATELQPTLSRS